MGQIHNQLSRGPWTVATKAALGISKSDGGVERFSETMQPTMDLWGPVEWKFLRSEKLAAMRRNEAGGAATTQASVAVINPAGSGMLAVIELLEVSIPATTSIRLGLDTQAAIEAALPTALFGMNADTRWANKGTEPAMRGRSGATATNLGSVMDEMTVLLNERTELTTARGVVLSPGFGIVVQNPDDTASIQTVWRWRERGAFRGELG